MILIKVHFRFSWNKPKIHPVYLYDINIDWYTHIQTIKNELNIIKSQLYFIENILKKILWGFWFISFQIIQQIISKNFCFVWIKYFLSPKNRLEVENFHFLILFATSLCALNYNDLYLQYIQGSIVQKPI